MTLECRVADSDQNFAELDFVRGDAKRERQEVAKVRVMTMKDDTVWTIDEIKGWKQDENSDWSEAVGGRR